MSLPPYSFKDLMSIISSSKIATLFKFVSTTDGHIDFSGTNQKPERRRPFGTGLVRHCPQGLFSPFFTFLRSYIFFRPFRLSLAPFICPWVSEDVPKSYRPKGQPRSTRNEFPIRADFGNSRKHPIWRLKRGEN